LRRNCPIKHFVEGKRRKKTEQLMDDLKEMKYHIALSGVLALAGAIGFT